MKNTSDSGLKLTAGQWTESDLIGALTGQMFVLPVMLTRHVGYVVTFIVIVPKP